MRDIARRVGLLQLVLLAVMLFGCASAVDDTGGTAEEAAADSQTLKGVAAPTTDATLDADAADCDAPALALADGTKAGAFAEFNSVLDSSSVNLDSPEIAGSTCTRVCKCCRNNGNRFCCSHCRLCSGPIGVSTEVFAP